MRYIITIFLFTFLWFAFGCTTGTSNPMSIDNHDQINREDLDAFIPIVYDNYSGGIGLLGMYSLILNKEPIHVQLTPLRTLLLGESYLVSGLSFFSITPCPDCLQLDGFEVYNEDTIKLLMSVKHPFNKGNTSEPPSAKNRLDLDIFDLALILNPRNGVFHEYPKMDVRIFDDIIINADGYTSEIAAVTGDRTLLPYKICYESPGNNRFEMGFGYEPFELVLKPGEMLEFDIFLTMGYGASAKKLQRLNPTYYVPEFNRKSAWKVIVLPPDIYNTWEAGDTTTKHDVTIDIYDWNHGFPIDLNFPDPSKTDYLSASSDVNSVTVEVPGMTNLIVNAVSTDTSSNGWDDPLTYVASFANENNLPPGEYTGLVKVKDSRIPSEAIGNTIAYKNCRTWGEGFSGSSCGDIEFNEDGDVFACGSFYGSTDFDPGPGEFIISSNGSSDSYLSKFDPDDNWLWTISIGSPEHEYMRKISLDYAGNIYCVGSFFGTVDFDPGPGIQERTPQGEADAFLLKLDSSGNFLWVHTFGSNFDDNEYRLSDSLYGIGISENSIYISGSFGGTVDFDPSPNAALKTSQGGSDAFLCKFDLDGNFIWVQTYGGTNWEYGGPIAQTNSFIYVYGRAGKFAYIGKFDFNGDLIWWKAWGGSERMIYPSGIDCDENENIYVTGTFDETVDFDPGSGVDLHTPIGRWDIYVSKFDSSGNFQWAISMGSERYDQGFDVKVFLSNYILVTGCFQDTIDLDPGPGLTIFHSNDSVLGDLDVTGDIFVSQYNNSGNFINAFTWGGKSGDSGNCIAISHTDSVYIGGEFRSEVDFDPGNRIEMHGTIANNTAFYSRFEPIGIPPVGASDSLIHSPNGIELNWLCIHEFAAYQTFKAIVK